jgi:diguanylate cyclase (GGDEF)-like protein
MVLMTVGAASLLTRTNALAATLVIWLVPNLARVALQHVDLFGVNMLLELPPLLGIALFTEMGKRSLESLEAENIAIGSVGSGSEDLDPGTGLYDERALRPALEMELARSTRFNRSFALVIVGIDSMRQRFDYRDEDAWEDSFLATAKMLRGTRRNIDRVYRYGVSSFAMLLPESTDKDAAGLIKRLSRAARRASPAEGAPGGPLPCHYGATFFPHCATTVDDLLRRAEIVMRIAEKNTTRVQLDGAEAPEMESPETMRTEPQPEAAEAPEAVATPESTPVAAPVMTGSVGALDIAMARLAEAPLAQPALPAEAHSHYADLAEATGTPAIVHLAAEETPGVTPEPIPAVEEPVPTPMAEHQHEASEMQDAVADLLRRMDETSEMMRNLRKAS